MKTPVLENPVQYEYHNYFKSYLRSFLSLFGSRPAQHQYTSFHFFLLSLLPSSPQALIRLKRRDIDKLLHLTDERTIPTQYEPHEEEIPAIIHGLSHQAVLQHFADDNHTFTKLQLSVFTPADLQGKGNKTTSYGCKAHSNSSSTSCELSWFSSSSGAIRLAARTRTGTRTCAICLA